MSPSRAVALLVIAFALAVLAVDPRGNFPLDDDWGVGFTTFTLARTGHIEFTPFASATAYLQFAWGALWTLLFGESFTVLRCATLTLSLGSTLLAYALLRRVHVAPKLALFGAAALLFHPLFFWASFTSMTHVPFVFVSLLSALVFVRAWEREGVWLEAAFAVTVLSFLTRQFAVLNALAPLLVALMYRRRRIAITYALALATFGLLAVSGILVGSQKELVLHRPTAAGLAFRAAHYLFFNWQNAALFFAPALLLVTFAWRPARASRVVMALAAIVFTYASWRMTVRVGMPIPYMNGGNVFTDFGLGPPTLRDVFTLHMRHPFALPFAVKVALMIATTVGAIWAAGLAASAIRVDDALLQYCLAYLVCGTLIVAVMSINFDRYSIDTAWPFGILLVLLASHSKLTRTGKLAALAALAVFVVFSIAGTAEYLAWNRARWDAYAYLRAHGVTLEQMDGGYEINALLALRHGRKDLGKPGVGVIDDRYILGFNRVPGYVALRSFEYPRWFGLSHGWVHAQRRVKPS